ncbi:hypothetical protein LUZ60_006140 [Juncus effusus]|nr:hypothetical protein LUZ60_006140 [Juncus effusus]
MDFMEETVNVPPIRGTEPNATLGGMDLNNSGSVVVKADRKLLTVSFPDGRTFTLKTETTEDLNEWKSALEHALIHAPSASISLGQNGIFRPDASDQAENPSEQQLVNEKPTVIHTPVDFALQDESGNASFLEKALCFIEDYGIKVEGILRQSADVEEVKRRVHDYEQGKDDFLPNEDAHVIGDCIKLVLREMPGYPVPAACCTTLVEVFRTERNGRLDAMRDVIYDTFPEPNRLLMQRILRMMLVVASHKSENRMSLQALAACMAPLLLRPLLVGDLEGDFNQSAAGDNSIQLLQAAAAANHAQAIVTILLEEFDHIFDDDEEWSEGYTDSEGHEEGSSENEIHEEDDDEEYSEEEDDDDDVTHEDDDDRIIHSSSDDEETHTNNAQSHVVIHPKSETNDRKEIRVPNSSISNSQQTKEIPQGKEQVESSNQMTHHASLSRAFKLSDRSDATAPGRKPSDRSDVAPPGGKMSDRSYMVAPGGRMSERADFKVSDRSYVAAPGGKMSERGDVAVPGGKVTERADVAAPSVKRAIMFGRTSARKNLSMESIEMSNSDDDEQVIQKLESTKIELQSKLAAEKKENESLQANLERRKEALHEKKLSLEKEVS